MLKIWPLRVSEIPRAHLTSRSQLHVPLKNNFWLLWNRNVRAAAHLRLRERGRMAGDLLPSSSVMLSELKCLVRKCSSSAVGWKGNWCSFSWDEHDDCEKQRGRDYKDRRHYIGCPDCQSNAFVDGVLLIDNINCFNKRFIDLGNSGQVKVLNVQRENLVWTDTPTEVDVWLIYSPFSGTDIFNSEHINRRLLTALYLELILL